uniref:Uncharacterized protein n=1 Tax=Peronospora matthiolae TaxID=2874970 RepID=A0AAV1T8T3_9STRA
MKETTDGLDCAAEDIGEFAKELVVSIRNMAPVEAEVAPISKTLRHLTDSVVVEEASEATVEAAIEKEWEHVIEKDLMSALVDETTVVAKPVVATPVVMEPVVAAPSMDEIKWSEELFMVRNIFQVMETFGAVDCLERCNGNVLVVVSALMEASAKALVAANYQERPADLII